MAAIKLPDRTSRLGAAMGRPNVIPPKPPDYDGNVRNGWVAKKLRMYRMPMSACGCYDNGGAYWGVGSRLIGFMYHAHADDVDVFVRATDREAAKRAVREVLPNCWFYR